MYSILLDNGKVKKTAKGVKSSYQQKFIKHEDYRKALYNKEETLCVNNSIQSRKHQVYSTSTIKKALSSFNDKRFLTENLSLAFGHKDIII